MCLPFLRCMCSSAWCSCVYRHSGACSSAWCSCVYCPSVARAAVRGAHVFTVPQVRVQQCVVLMCLSSLRCVLRGAHVFTVLQVRVQQCVVSLAGDHSVALLSLKEMRVVLLAAHHPCPVVAVKWRPLHDFLVVATADGALHVWQMDTGLYELWVFGRWTQVCMGPCTSSRWSQVCMGRCTPGRWTQVCIGPCTSGRWTQVCMGPCTSGRCV